MSKEELITSHAGPTRFEQTEGTTKILKRNFVMASADKSLRNSPGTAVRQIIPWALGLESYKKSVPLQEKGCDSSTQTSSFVPAEPHHLRNARENSPSAQRPYLNTEVRRERMRSICISSKLPF